jgi:hypothetical protein
MRLILAVLAVLFLGTAIFTYTTSQLNSTEQQRQLLELQRIQLELQRQQQQFEAQMKEDAQLLPLRVTAWYVAAFLSCVTIVGLGYVALDRYNVRRELVAPNRAGQWPSHIAGTTGLAYMREDYQGKAAIRRWEPPAMPPQTYSPHFTIRGTSRELEKAILPSGDTLAELPAPEPQLPGVTDMMQLLRQGFKPSKQNILLGLGPGGTQVRVAADDTLCHVAVAGSTGSGKSNIMRSLTAQLIASGMDVYILDPHFAPIDDRSGEDWRPIAERSALGRAVFEPTEISLLIHELNDEVTRRLENRREGRSNGIPRFYMVEEAPFMASYDKKFMANLMRVLREGRKLDLYLILSAQDMLVKTLGGSTGIRSQFGTTMYGGGDPFTGRALLRTQKDVPEPPGRGVVWCRSATNTQPQLVRVPLVSNDSLYKILDWRPGTIAATPVQQPLPQSQRYIGDTPGIDDTRVLAAKRSKSTPITVNVAVEPLQEPTEATSDLPATLPEVALDSEGTMALKLFMETAWMPDVVRTVRQIEGKASGFGFERHNREIQTALRDTLLSTEGQDLLRKWGTTWAEPTVV